MRTARLLPVSPSMHCVGGCTCPGEVYLPLVRGVYLPLVLGGCTCWGGVPTSGPGGGVPASDRGGVYLPRYSPPVNRITDTCENITLPQTSFAGGKNCSQLVCLTEYSCKKLVKLYYNWDTMNKVWPHCLGACFNKEHWSFCRYVRALGAIYMRLTGTSLDCYQYLEPLYLDYRKLRRMNKMGSKLSSSCSILTLHWVPLTTILTTMSRFQNFLQQSHSRDCSKFYQKVQWECIFH